MIYKNGLNNFYNINQNMIENTDIQFHQYPSSGIADRFGIFKLKTRDTPLVQRPQRLYFTNDCSGSMQDKCGDGRSKMEHSIHIIQNIVRLLAKETELETWVRVVGFDDEIEVIVPDTRITSDNFPFVLSNLEKMIPKSGTNFELALSNAANDIQSWKEEDPDCDITHFFITDGNISGGSFDVSYLSGLVGSGCHHYFIGLGADHSAETLVSLSSSTNASYVFIDHMETSSIAFGEMVHSILFRCLRDVWIKISGGSLYDYKLGIWVDELYLSFLTGDTEKTFYISSSDPYEVSLSVYGIPCVFSEKNIPMLLTNVLYYPPLYDATEIWVPPDLTIHILRQKTLEWLWKAQHTRMNEDVEINKIRLGMEAFLDSLCVYTDPLVEKLRQDLRIAIRTIGTHFGTMYISSRKKTIGEESAFTDGGVLVPENITPKMINVMRSVSDGNKIAEQLLSKEFS